MNNLLTINEAAEKLKISKSTLRKIMKEGRIKSVEISTSRGDRRFTEEEIERFIKENTV
jgi:excisionase family DNA binding protein